MITHSSVDRALSRIGARILREHALAIGLNPDFSIHDREDSADFLNLCRHGLGLSNTKSRFPAKGTCLSIFSRAVNAEVPLSEVLPRHFPWCAAWEVDLKHLFGAYVSAKQEQNVLDYDDLLLAWAFRCGSMSPSNPATGHSLRSAPRSVVRDFPDIRCGCANGGFLARSEDCVIDLIATAN